MVADIISNVQSFFRKVNQRIRDGGALVCFLEEITDRDKGRDNNLPTASVLHGLQSLGWVVKKLGRSRKG